MPQRRKLGVPLNIPFVDDSSGVMANGVPIGRPETPPIIRITIPESEVYEPQTDKKDSKIQKRKPELESQNDNANKTEVEDKVDSAEQKPISNKETIADINQVDNKGAEEGVMKSLDVPLTKRHRRNSISLPAGLDTLDIQVISENANGDTDDTFSDVDESECNTDLEETKVPLRSARKKSVMPVRSPGADPELDIHEHSPGNSITSINSISSLLKEKLSMEKARNIKIIFGNLRRNPVSSGSSANSSQIKKPLEFLRSFTFLALFVFTLLICIIFSFEKYHYISNSFIPREKALSSVALPGLLKAKRKPKNYKLKAFVVILFLCLVFLIGFAYVFYHQQVLQRAYFDRIRFNNEEKVVRVYDNDGNELLSGYLGTTINSHLVFKCLKKDEFDDGSVCMEWMHRARLYLRFRNPHPRVRCYQITWQSLNYLINPTDCFDWSTGGHWYGGGQTQNMTWPAELGVVKLSPFITGDIAHQQWGNVLQRYFLNSKGVSISIDQETPLYVAIDTFNNEKRFCIQARYDNFVYYYRNTILPVLNYSICTSNNIKILHGYMSEKSLWDGLKEKDIETIYSLLTEPVWQIGPDHAELLTESVLYNYTEDVIALAFLRQGHVLLNEMWQKHIGDFTVDVDRFPTLADTIKILQRRGFKIVLSIQPFISTESINFQAAVKEGLLVSERSSYSIPALTRYKGLQSAGMLDITNNQSIPWLQERLYAVVKKYNINSFYLDLGSTYNMPHFYRFEKKLVNPDQYKTLFTEGVLQYVEVIGVSSAVQRPRPPVFVSLPPLPSTWESLTLIIPTVLTYGIIGYPFIMPGPVGGDFYSETVLANYTYMYIKSVENALLQKSLKSFFNKSKTESEIKFYTENLPQPLENNTTKETNFEDNLKSEENVTQEQKSSEFKLDNKNPETASVFSVNYENFFNQNLNSSAAADIIKNMTTSKASDILEKASESFPGDIMLNDQAPEFIFLPDKELYMRWLQLATFLPVIRFTYLPSKYKDDSVLEMAKILTNLRVKIVNPLLKKYAKEALDSGLPIIRPLWMLDPSDPTCHTVVDEFSVGEELIVAPVIQAATTEREVYLPAGVWKDGIDGSLRKGSRWIHKYKVPQKKIAYFVKMPDNTRF